MITGRSSIDIARPVATVYDFVVVRFFDNYPRWSPQVRELEALNGRDIALGTRGRQVRVDQGRRSETRFQVTRLEPERAVDFDGDKQAKFAIRYRFEPKGEQACRLSMEFELKQLDLFMRPFEKLIRLAVQDGTDQTVRNIKRLVEHEH
ncbi:MAG: polyketide cyclase [Proteobacteria bacterium SW_6_67_9]|nr:MAG: polyketide cyclase [Proteobacteria bacterium SW_6_67_9]